MSEPHLASETAELLAELSPKYLWWRPVDGEGHPPERIIAQIMNLGTYDDIRRLEHVFAPAELGQVMRRAQPGWFTPRSWEFWRGRLSVAGIGVAATPPRRTFHVVA
jgi:hypothetical protein